MAFMNLVFHSLNFPLSSSNGVTFWTTLNPQAYPFESNVNPRDTYPWPQNRERMLGPQTEYETMLYNGYAEQVAELYPRH